MPAPLNYQTPSPAFLDPDPPPYGLASLLYGSSSAISATLFLSLRSASPFSVAMIFTFPLVAMIPIFALTGVVRGVDAVAFRRQSSLAIPGLVLSLLSLVALAHTLVTYQ